MEKPSAERESKESLVRTPGFGAKFFLLVDQVEVYT